MRFRNPLVECKIMKGGIAKPDALPESFVRGAHSNFYRLTDEEKTGS